MADVGEHWEVSRKGGGPLVPFGDFRLSSVVFGTSM